MKRHMWKTCAAISAVFFLVGICIVGCVLSPYNPRNVSDKEVIRKGAEYTVKLSGVSDYDENGFMPVTNGLYLNEETFVEVGEDGFIYSNSEKKTDIRLDGRYCSFYMDYDDYIFCSEVYKSREELEQFFESPDRIYNFDINELSTYIQDIIAFKKQFYGEAKVRIYRGRCVITELYIGDEKTFVHKDIV